MNPLLQSSWILNPKPLTMEWSNLTPETSLTWSLATFMGSTLTSWQCSKIWNLQLSPPPCLNSACLSILPFHLQPPPCPSNLEGILLCTQLVELSLNNKIDINIQCWSLHSATNAALSNKLFPNVCGLPWFAKQTLDWDDAFGSKQRNCRGKDQ